MIYILVPQEDLYKTTFLEELEEYFDKNTGQDITVFSEGTIPSDLKNKEFLRISAEDFYNEHPNS